jgi:biopolymer transport protein ExbB/TolQ
MGVMALAQSFIYLISASLLLPDMLLLCLNTVIIIFYAGVFFSDWLERARMKTPGPEELKKCASELDGSGVLPHGPAAFLRALKAVPQLTGADAALLAHREISRMMKSMDKLKIIVRAGPGLGLIGTLIPMGTGLASLGQGDIAKLNAEMVIAFTATVVGLSQGLAAYFFYIIRRRWLDEDSRNIEYLAEIISDGKN